jgi:hypothetical protein
LIAAFKPAAFHQRINRAVELIGDFCLNGFHRFAAPWFAPEMSTLVITLILENHRCNAAG